MRGCPDHKHCGECAESAAEPNVDPGSCMIAALLPGSADFAASLTAICQRSRPASGSCGFQHLCRQAPIFEVLPFCTRSCERCELLQAGSELEFVFSNAGNLDLNGSFKYFVVTVSIDVTEKILNLHRCIRVCYQVDCL